MIWQLDNEDIVVLKRIQFGYRSADGGLIFSQERFKFFKFFSFY